MLSKKKRQESSRILPPSPTRAGDYSGGGGGLLSIANDTELEGKDPLVHADLDDDGHARGVDLAILLLAEPHVDRGDLHLKNSGPMHGHEHRAPVDRFGGLDQERSELRDRGRPFAVNRLERDRLLTTRGAVPVPLLRELDTTHPVSGSRSRLRAASPGQARTQESLHERVRDGVITLVPLRKGWSDQGLMNRQAIDHRERDRHPSDVLAIPALHSRVPRRLTGEDQGTSSEQRS